jgi:flagellar hook-associated protein 2
VGITPITLTGVSQYATDFQNVLNRAVQIAQIPLTALQNRDSDILQQKTLLGTLSTSVSTLASTLQSLGTIASHQALAASSSAPTVVSATNSGATAPASYTINSITSVAAAASERSLNHYADSTATPVSSTGAMKLTVGFQDYSFTLTKNTLVGLRDQINGLGAGVTASILTTAGGNYLSVSANATGAATLTLTDDPTTPGHAGADTAVLTSSNQGTDAVFQLNGINISQKSNLVNSVIPGVTLRLLGASGSPVTVSLATDRTQLSSTLQTFTDNLNALKTQLQAQTGKNAGMLSGDGVVSGLQNLLGQLTAYHLDSGTTKSLADLGITFDSTGKASFDQTAFNSLSDTQVADGFKFLGSATTGLGGFSARLQQYSDPVTGLIKVEQDGIDRTDKNLQNRIGTLTDRINAMQTALSQRLAVADSLQSQLQSQQSALTASLQGLNLVLYGKSPNQ